MARKSRPEADLTILLPTLLQPSPPPQTPDDAIRRVLRPPRIPVPTRNKPRHPKKLCRRSRPNLA